DLLLLLALDAAVESPEDDLDRPAGDARLLEHALERHALPPSRPDRLREPRLADPVRLEPRAPVAGALHGRHELDGRPASACGQPPTIDSTAGSRRTPICTPRPICRAASASSPAVTDRDGRLRTASSPSAAAGSSPSRTRHSTAVRMPISTSRRSRPTGRS